MPQLACRNAHHRLAVVFALVVCVMLVGGAVAAGGRAQAGAGRNPTDYGLWVLAPAVAAIVCAVVSRQVVPSLLMGVVVAVVMLLPCAQMAERYAQSHPVTRTARITIEHYVIEAIRQPDHVKVVMFSLIIGGMVGVINVNGGTSAMVRVIARHANTRRKGQLACWVAGLVVFFDDYANTMIIGPTMQPISDRLRISRAKLAYIVDSTAAPVASIAVVGTWVGAEMGYIQDGLLSVAGQPGGTPLFLDGVDKWQAFIHSIPYRFYPILAIVLVLWVALSGRDMGPMLRAERDAQTEQPDAPDGSEAASGGRGSWLMGALPIAVLIVATFTILAWPGLTERPPGTPLDWRNVFSHPHTDAYGSILYGSILSAALAIGMTVVTRAGTLGAAMDGFTQGMSRMFGAIVVLILAWALSAASSDLMVGEVVGARLSQWGFSFTWLPVAVFFSAALVSFATGTSWGTMGILCPMVVMIAADLGRSLPPDRALQLFYASVGSVLAGAIFGDHCSPISDTTVLSSVASGCRHEIHVWTQIPYALLAAVVGMGCGDLMCAKLGASPWVGLGVGITVLVIVGHLVSRRVEVART